MFVRCDDKACNHEYCKLSDWAEEAPTEPEWQRRAEILYQALLRGPGMKPITGMDIWHSLFGGSDKIQEFYANSIGGTRI